MIKASSLLYAVYICLIVGVICGALLFYSSLYSQLNIYYNTREELYIHNQSSVNYALTYIDKVDSVEGESGMYSNFDMVPYGLLSILTVRSYVGSDTITSIHFVGQESTEKTCVYLPADSKPLSYFGTVKLIGIKTMPAGRISESYINSGINNLISVGASVDATDALPSLNKRFKNPICIGAEKNMTLAQLQTLNGSIYYNSFSEQTITIGVATHDLNHKSLKGNFIIKCRDSLVIAKNTILEDVILIAPKITFEDGFHGSVQAFASEKIQVGKNVRLDYPSIICINNEGSEKSEIVVKEDTQIFGAIVSFGFEVKFLDRNSITFSERSVLTGDIYCQGKAFLKGKLFGSVYTNRFSTATNSGIYENCISDVEINVERRPDYFISIPLFNSHGKYNTLKKVF